MAKVAIIPAESGHISPIAAHARKADRDELWAAAHSTPWEAMALGIGSSTRAWTGLIDDRHVCMFGVSPVSVLGGIGVPWMIGTDLLERYQFTFLRHCRPRVSEMLLTYHTLVNHVDERNHVAIRWLRWLGFDVGAPEPYGLEQMSFRQFTMYRKVSELCASR